MKRVNGEYLKIVIYVVFSVVLVISLYLIIINVRHYSALSQKVVVSEIDSDYIEFKKNVNTIEQLLNNHSNSNHTSLKNTLDVLKKSDVFSLLPNTKLTYHDLYILNDYFMNDVINNCWVSQLAKINNNKSNNEIINLLINNSSYLNSHFINNGLILYDSFNEKSIQSDYEMILKNYVSFSNILLSMLEN